MKIYDIFLLVLTLIYNAELSFEFKEWWEKTDVIYYILVNY